MPPDTPTGHRGADLMCAHCHTILATLHQAATPDELEQKEDDTPEA
jgi:hypothetical protein